MSVSSEQITEYLSVGGLFNPEIMNQTQHEAVRDTLIKARDDIQKLERENAALRKALRSSCDEERSLIVSEGPPHSTCGLVAELERENAALRKAIQKCIESADDGDWQSGRRQLVEALDSRHVEAAKAEVRAKVAELEQARRKW